MTGYRKMQEEDFNKIDFPVAPDKCSAHDYVKLYDGGTHSDYGCIRCGHTTMIPESDSTSHK